MLLLVLINALRAGKSEVWGNTPLFKVKSRDDKELTLDMLKGKVAVIPYEAKGVTEENQALKEALEKLSRDEN